MKFVFEEQGFTNQAARDQIWSTASFAALIAAIGGRIVVGFLADRMSRKTVMVVTYAQVALAIPLLFLITPQTPQYAYLFGIVFGFAMGADYMLIPLMAADVFGLRTLGRAMSAIVPGDTITQYWSPNLIARLRGVWGGYGSALWVAWGSRRSAPLRSRSCPPSRRPLRSHRPRPHPFESRRRRGTGRSIPTML